MEIIQNKAMLKTSGIFILIILSLFILWRYEMNRYVRVNRELKQADAKLENYRDCLQNGESYTRQYRQIQETLAQAEQRCYRNKTTKVSTTCLLEDIQKIIGTEATSIIRIEVLPEKEIDAKYVRIGVNLRLRTDSSGLADTLHRLKNSDKIYQVSQLSVFVASDGWLEVEMRVNAVHMQAEG